jgi:heme exporter protein A
MIKVHCLTKRYGLKTILNELDFNAERGEFVGLVGPNGAGKTTFLRILATLASPTSGQIRIGGFLLPQEGSSARRNLGFVSHQPLLYGDLSPEENLRFFARLYGISEKKERINAILELVGLQTNRRTPVRIFSRGMQQRLAIGRAVLHEPELLLLDEPHTGLDQEATEMLDQVLRDVAGRGRTVLMTSHDLTRVGGLADRVDVLSKGRIVATAKHDQLNPDQIHGFYRQALFTANNDSQPSEDTRTGKALDEIN